MLPQSVTLQPGSETYRYLVVNQALTPYTALFGAAAFLELIEPPNQQVFSRIDYRHDVFGEIVYNLPGPTIYSDEINYGTCKMQLNDIPLFLTSLDQPAHREVLNIHASGATFSGFTIGGFLQYLVNLRSYDAAAIASIVAGIQVRAQLIIELTCYY
jgi:hypothetical protein